MTEAVHEARLPTIRLLKCTLETEHCRAYWEHASDGRALEARTAFEEYWFGARSLARVHDLLANLRARFDAFPPSLAVLHRWPRMSVETRRVVCHWHLQLADVLYRRFTGAFLPGLRDDGCATVTRDKVIGWLATEGPARWTLSTRIQYASKLLTSAQAAGLVGARRDPRPLTTPRVPDTALAYLLYLLRGLEFEGTLLANPYLNSVGLAGESLVARLRELPDLRLEKQGSLVHFDWRYSDLSEWAEARLQPLEVLEARR